MRPFALVSAFPLCFLASGAAPAAPPAASGDPTTVLQREALSDSHAFDIVRSLCDEVGPRLAGSSGDRAAVDWAHRKMTSLGLTRVHAEPVQVTHWERGSEHAEIVSGNASPQPLVVTAIGGSVATPARGVEGEVVEAGSIAELEKLDGAAVRGKIVFLNATTRRSRDGAGYGETVGNRYRGAGEAAKLGAVALVIRSVGTDHDRIAHTGAKAKDEHEIPAAALSVPDAELLHRVLAERKAARLRLVLGAHTGTVSPSANVIGDIPGSEHPEQIVVVGAHLDSWDLGTGAIDDGAGVAIALETARVIAAMPERPRRTVRIVLFANEEHGAEGAHAYASVHAGEADKYIVAMEADSGADAAYGVRWLGDPAARERFSLLERALAPLSVVGDDEAGGAGTDVLPLQELGVPILEMRQDGTRYFDYHHSANDTLDKIDPPSLAQAAAAFATAAWTAANMEGTFGRVPEALRKNAR